MLKSFNRNPTKKERNEIYFKVLNAQYPIQTINLNNTSFIKPVIGDSHGLCLKVAHEWTGTWDYFTLVTNDLFPEFYLFSEEDNEFENFDNLLKLEKIELMEFMLYFLIEITN